MSDDRVSLEIQLWRLRELGIDLAEGCGIGELLASCTREQYEANPYALLLPAMGGESEAPGFEFLSDDVVHLDMECIAEPSDYAPLAARIAGLARHVAAVTGIRVTSDEAEDSGRIAFEAGSERYVHDVVVQDDWVDLAFLDLMGRAIRSAAPSVHLLVGTHTMGSQDILLCVGDGGKRAALGELTRGTWGWEAAT